MYFTGILSLSYSFFLLILITCLSTILRRRKEYKKEARSIWILSMLFLAVMVMTCLATTLITRKHTRHIQGLCCECVVFLSLLILLLPRARHVCTGQVSPQAR